MAAEVFTAGPDTAVRAALVLARCDELAGCTTEPGRITRPYGTPALAAAREQIAALMRDCGMAVHTDAIGNLRGRYAGHDPAAPALLLGSHLDSVRDAGRYDGPLGVLTALAAVERLHHEDRRLPFPIEVVAFADEEGLRFQATYLGSRALASAIDPALLDLRDEDGVTLNEAIATFGGDPALLPSAALRPGEAFGYVEVHIEQGPHLETLDVPLGVVTAIAGQTRAAVTFRGEAGHAGTVAMALRKDAFPAAAEFVLAVEERGRQTPEMVATVGSLSVSPGASNVIPASARLTLDLRHPHDAERERAAASLAASARQIAERRGLDLDWTIVQENAAVPCDPALTAMLARAMMECGIPVTRLPSGAGHDAVLMSTVVPVAMLFVRCAGGVSHHPAEAVSAEDVAAAVVVLDRLLDALAEVRP